MSDKKKVMLIIDDPNISNCIVSNLSNNGYDIRTINSDDRVLENIQHYKPEIILVDVHLEKTDASYLSKTIKEKNRNRDLKIILIEHGISNGNINNADDHLITPFSISQLLSKIGTSVTTYVDDGEDICR